MARIGQLVGGEKVAVVLGTSTGGVGEHVRLLVRGLVAREMLPAVLGPASTDEAFGFGDEGARFAPVDIGAAPRPHRDAAAVLRLRRLLRGADVVHAHGLRAGFLAGLALGPRRHGRTPLAVTWHNAVLGEGMRRRVYVPLEAGAARLADVSLCASSDLVGRVREVGGHDVRLAPVAAPPLPAPTRPRDEIREELGVGDRPLLLAVGRLAPQKGYPLLLDAAATWARRPDRPLLVVAGSGPLLTELERRVRREHLEVVFLGHRSDVANLLGAADAVVLPSVWEARSLVAQEALRAGVPLVATAVGGIPELVGDAAMLVPFGDADLLAHTVEQVLDEPGLADRLVAAGHARARAWYGVDDTVDQVVAVYRELAGT
ncbi:MAG: glycosyltransferase [Streptosporangiales bacterium]|nr:glycosyltransferase [Streptosporangiales bacterium]